MPYNINISSYDDYKQNFGDKYCDANKNIKSEYKGKQFAFKINFSEEIWNGFRAIELKYGQDTVFLSHVHFINDENANGYIQFCKYFTEWINNRYRIKENYAKTAFVFSINFQPEIKVNELLIHNFLLLQDSLSNRKTKLILNINKEYKTENRNEENSDKGRISTYIADHKLKNKCSVYFNGRELNWFPKSINKLFPAVFIDAKALKFLQNTINIDTWKTIINYKKIDKDSFKAKSPENRHWLILRVCQNYLFDDFDNNSYTYTILRRLLYSNPNFYERHIKHMSLLAVLIFAQYDYYFRSNMLKKYKATKMSNLNCSDFLIELQENQSLKNYIQYNKLKQCDKLDVKTLIKYDMSAKKLLENIENPIKRDFIQEMNDSESIKRVKIIIGKIWETYYLPLITAYLFDNFPNRYINVSMNKTDLSQTCFLLMLYIYYSDYLQNDGENLYYIKENIVNDFSNSLLPKFSVSKKDNNGNLVDYKRIKSELNMIIQTKVEDAHICLQNTIKKIQLTEREVKILDAYIKNLKAHDDIISELFEAATISEGLLQLIENSVVHANGGLLSVHIRDMYDEDDKKYLKSIEYADYFANNKISDDFYLEIELSDISQRDMKNKFIDNIEKRSDEIEIKMWYEHYKTVFDHAHPFELFYAPNRIENAEEAWRKYYNISKNQVHHYGLQIFESIVTSKDGLFTVRGHKYYYNNKGNYIQNIDQYISGTSYRILLPLSHMHTEGKKIVNDSAFEKMMEYSQIKKYYKEESNLICSALFGIKELNKINYDRPKEEIIEAISHKIEKISLTSNYLLIINCNGLDNLVNCRIELLIKGLLLFLFNLIEGHSELIPPVAIVNMTSHHLLEASRIIALFYNKQGEATEKFRKIQIYLKGKEVGEEIIFAGDNLNQNAWRMRKIAMTRGIMFDYWAVAQILMRRSLEEKKTNKIEPSIEGE